MTARKFLDVQAKRAKVPLLIGIAGLAGSGKTFSALRLATGISRIYKGPVFGIDTEAGRMLHYAERFTFRHVPFAPPFGPLDYLDAIRHCVSQGAGCVVVDSASHCHEGPGGTLDQHERLLDKWCGEDEGKRDKNKMRAWIEPKRELQRFVQGIVQLNTPIIFGFRARDKIKPGMGGKPEDMGTMAIADSSLIFEMTAQALLEPGCGGVPNWKPGLKGEAIQTKLPEQFRKLLESKGPLSEEMGEFMGRWAMGDATEPAELERGKLPTDAPKAREQAPSAPESASALGSLLADLAAASSTDETAKIAAAFASTASSLSDDDKARARNAIKSRNRELQS